MIDYDLLPQSPSDKILREVEATLRTFDWAAFGLEDLTIRHARNAYAAPTQLPCLTIRWISDEPRQSDQEQSYYTSDEMGVEMTLTLEIDVELAAEEDEEGLSLDPTGIKLPSAIAMLAQRALRDEEGPLLANWADGISDRGRSVDDQSTTDDGRFDQSVIVVYRVSTLDPSILLARGMNA